MPPLVMLEHGDIELAKASRVSNDLEPRDLGVPEAECQYSGQLAARREDLDASIGALEKAHTHLRNAIESGPGGRQILLDDPDGNPIELHEALKH